MVADARCREAQGASRGNADPFPVKRRVFPQLALRASQQPGTIVEDRRERPATGLGNPEQTLQLASSRAQ
jgi:hypothetical protein